MTVLDWPTYMRRAIELSCSVWTATPNPRVGCVIAKTGAMLGEGWHVGSGQPHAEVVALGKAGVAAKGATAFVSLEPCSHTGRTGPCSEALVESGIQQVVIATLDPNPVVAGKGVEQMEQAGIEVYHLLDFEQEARSVNAGYFKRREHGLPFVRLKLAMSLDGRTALASGESKWITGIESRSDVQKLRASASAVITGIN
ncbi:MAG: bifunctional diaminohydroxyphosphoribosylaminopyrimidine deaminase/5-amino-6-(5-phosphoribosylamino)uracil reductase RibD, partial [Pseudomonadota bacterium]|nr:bifunctional diaminohydroxyphosphoribosylaminopyrimidine deaminase/5-amino-6-(5-phosphoribosylamino)uracil reductase RibD [Pseudomonadota bacterium]